VKIFISYSRADAGNFAKHIHKYLTDNGHAVFTDVNSITIGDPWAHSIEKNISECDIFIVILTPDSLRSSHIEREVLQAQREDKIIVPCIHEHVDYSKIKWDLDNIQGIEFSDKFDLALNLYPKITNYENLVHEKQNNIPQQKMIHDINRNISEDVDVVNEKGIAPKNLGKYLEVSKPDVKGVGLKLYNIGITLYNEGKYQEAIAYYDIAVNLTIRGIQGDNPLSNIIPLEGQIKLGYIFNAKGNALYKQGKYQEAIAYYDKALSIDPNHANALNNKGLSLVYLGKYQEAIEYFDKALSIDPYDVRAQDNKKIALEHL
jgi:tetratricopeptide (TPR) repeat protein